MRNYDVFSKRNKTFQFDFLTYDSVPIKLRNQVYFIWKDSLGAVSANTTQPNYATRVFDTLHDVICREHGVSSLSSKHTASVKKCEEFLRFGSDVEMLLDLIELSIRLIEPFQEDVYYNFSRYSVTLDAKGAIEELNNRFRENGIGYEFVEGVLIRKDSEFLHEEATKPALHLLQQEGFEGALDEFLEAHDHFRKGEHKACIVSASNAFESTMKNICAKRGWEIKGSGTSSQLISALVENGLIPSYLDTHVNSLRNMLAGLSNVRNKKAGHGQGEEANPVPEHFVNYTLHLCATNIVFLIESYKVLEAAE